MIWMTSSRVGAMTSAAGRPVTVGRVSGASSMRFMIAMRNAAVLPVPVWARPATLSPAIVRSSEAAWIGVQYSKPRSAMPCSSGIGSVKSVKRLLPAFSGTSYVAGSQSDSGTTGAGNVLGAAAGRGPR